MLVQDLADNTADYVLQTARQVVDSFGPRPPGSDGEERAQRFLQDELARVTDGPVRFEAFPVAQKAFFSTPRITGALLFEAIVGWWVSPVRPIRFGDRGIGKTSASWPFDVGLHLSRYRASPAGRMPARISSWKRITMPRSFRMIAPLRTGFVSPGSFARS